MSTSGQPSEEELRAAYEEEIKRLRVEQVLLESIVSLVNLGMRRTGLAPGTESELDIGQVRLAIESVRALLPLIEQVLPEQAGPIRDAVSQLQLAFVKIGGTAPAGTGSPEAAPSTPGAQTSGGGASGGPASGDAPPSTPPASEPKPGEPGPAQRSGRLWIPGQ